jgi:hypothetical protein
MMWSADAQELDRAVLATLRARDGQATTVVLKDGQSLEVLNIAWGYEKGEPFAHITTNISPDNEGLTIDFFLTGEVGAIRDPFTGATLWTTPSSGCSRPR